MAYKHHYKVNDIPTANSLYSLLDEYAPLIDVIKIDKSYRGSRTNPYIHVQLVLSRPIYCMDISSPSNVVVIDFGKEKQNIPRPNSRQRRQWLNQWVSQHPEIKVIEID